MKRFLITVAYDGTNYCGWQFQPNVKTIEGCLNSALSDLTGEETTVVGASRTDAGVHAFGNIAVFDSNTKIPPEKLPYALNRKLPNDIKVQNGIEVCSEFHPRKQKTRKVYEYHITNRQIEFPTDRFYSYFTYHELNLEAMRKAAEYLIGKHDFTSMCSVKTEKLDKVRTIYNIEIIQQNYHIIIRVTGNGFLYNMVRILAGTLIKVGEGNLSPYEMKDILDAKDRTRAGITLPPQGLFLVSITWE